MSFLKGDVLLGLPTDLKAKATHMSKAYEYLYCIENSLRLLLDKYLANRNLLIPIAIQKIITTRQLEEGKNRWLSLRGNSPIFYLDFKDIGSLIIANWNLLKDEFPSQYWIIAKIEDLYRYRNMIAHNSFLDSQDLDMIKANGNAILKQLNGKTIKSTEITPDTLFVEGLVNNQVFTLNQTFGGVELALNYPLELTVLPLKLTIFFNQTHLNFRVDFETSSVYLRPSFNVGMEFDGECSSYKENILFQIGQYDIDNDGIDELFICILDESENEANGIQVNIFKFFPPAYKAHSFRKENWELIGDFHMKLILGRPRAFIKGQSITIPRNLRGYYAEWTYSQGEFRETGNL